MAEGELKELYERYVRVTFNEERIFVYGKRTHPYIGLEGDLKIDTSNFVVLNKAKPIILHKGPTSPSQENLRVDKEFEEERTFVAKSSILEIKVIKEPGEDGN
jgi:hypothetical protein